VSTVPASELVAVADEECVPPPLRARRLLKHGSRVVLAFGGAALLVAALPGFQGIRHHLAHARPGWLVVSVTVELASALGFVVVLRAMFCPRLPWKLSSQLGLSELAANSVLPAGGAGGLALGAWTLAHGGMSRARIAQRTVAFFLVTSAANFLAVVCAGAGVALGVLPGRAPLVLTLVPAGIAAVAIAAVMFLPKLLPHPTPVVCPSPAPEALARIRRFSTALVSAIRGGIHELRTLLGSRRRMAVLGSLGYLTFDIATLAACFQATGSTPPAGVFVLAYTIGQLGGAIPLPGGVGATEGGLIGALVLYGAAIVPATAAVLLFRVVQLGVPLLLGPPAYLFLRRTLRRPEAFAADCDSMEMAEMGARTHGHKPGWGRI